MRDNQRRIAPLDRWPRHDAALAWLDRLILDLKLIELGEQPGAPVDLVRLQEWEQHRKDIEQCKDRMLFY